MTSTPPYAHGVCVRDSDELHRALCSQDAWLAISTLHYLLCAWQCIAWTLVFLSLPSTRPGMERQPPSKGKLAHLYVQAWCDF